MLHTHTAHATQMIQDMTEHTHTSNIPQGIGLKQHTVIPNKAPSKSITMATFEIPRVWYRIVKDKSPFVGSTCLDRCCFLVMLNRRFGAMSAGVGSWRCAFFLGGTLLWQMGRLSMLSYRWAKLARNLQKQWIASATFAVMTRKRTAPGAQSQLVIHESSCFFGGCPIALQRSVHGLNPFCPLLTTVNHNKSIWYFDCGSNETQSFSIIIHQTTIHNAINDNMLRKCFQ